MSNRVILGLAILLTLGGCIGRSDRRPRPGPRATHRPQRPATQPTIVRRADPAVLRQCLGKLDQLVARYALLPDRTFSGSCDALGSVQLRDIGTPTTNLGAMTCGLANAYVQWVQNDLQGPADAFLRSRVVKIETFGTYACRNVNGAASGRISEHAHANAVDVSAFVLEDGRRITVANDRTAGGDAAAFLRAIRASACGRFVTVLSPEYNALHHDHLHFDMGGKSFCR